MRTIQRALMVSVVGLLFACAKGPEPKLPVPVSPANHPWFPIGAGVGHEYGSAEVAACESCHPSTAQSYTEFRCIECHKHDLPMTNRLHLGVTDFVATNEGCYQCHPSGERVAFSHTSITADASGQCAQCHQEGASWARLPKPGFTHRPPSPGECGTCHQNFTDWANVRAGASNAFDPLRNLAVNALQPSWVGTSIVSVAADPQLIPMTMDHLTTAIDAGVLEQCSNCHAQADQGQFYPGVLHFSLIALGAPQPTTCLDCHRDAAPKNFVGALDSARSPSTGAMKHDAVIWDGGTPTTTPAFALECQLCHEPPLNLIDTQWTFAAGRGDGGSALFHASLTAAGRPQPSGCLDCHANTRPLAPLPTFDHSTALGECRSCHVSTTTWTGGQFHSATAPAPATCLPCHASDRPTTPNASYLFDFGTNANGVAHGGDQDCASCHRGPGTGAWGVNANWLSGSFPHGPNTLAATTCIDCHTTQRPDLLVPPADAGFDHAVNGTGDCFACHQPTVTRGRYVDLRPIPGGDWRGGQTYPGDVLVSSPGQSVRLPSTTLTRSGTWVTGMSTSTVTLPNSFVHTSARIAAAISPGSAAAPDKNSCWHWHATSGTTVVSFAAGEFHAALDNFRGTPDAGITPLAQPTACNDCHSAMRPPNIVSKTDAGTPWLLPMDHRSAGADAMDCGSCHRTPGLGPTQWSDGVFHANASGSPAECVSCHYPLSTTAQADVTADGGAPQRFTMRHRSGQVTNQACASCHSTALGNATRTPKAMTLWKTGAFHSTLTTQPAQCLECHSVSDPVIATQSMTTYPLTQGGTATNGGQWMNHQHVSVTGRDCSVCHAGQTTNWSRSTQFHANSTGVTGCATCHGLNNGRGTTVGTNNNLPVGLIDSATVTTSSAAAAGTFDQIAHTDLNVTRVECNFCHTQVGPSTGQEWTRATFHRSFTSANALQVNGTTARCDNCHLNLKPGSTFTAFNHTTITSDCASCHAWPGTGTAMAPNWLGAAGAHASSGPTATSTLDCNTCHGNGGNSSKHLTVPAAMHYGGITNGNKCTSCHIDFSGFKGTIANLKYGHTNAAANSGAGCASCHVFASQLYTTLTTTPPLTLPTMAGGHQFSQATSVTGRTANCGDTNPNGCFTSTHANAGLGRCGSCHQYAATTATTNVWAFKHRPTNPGISSSTSSQGCSMCH